MAAYCRVSTERDDQQNSLTSQKRYFKEYIERHSGWQLSKIYVDEGISGTATKKRHAFNQMIDDAHRHEFDLILTKEISRFARNTLDSIYYTRELKDLGIGVLFLNDNINTLDPDAELRLTILSSIAQEESRKTSERVKWGQKRRMEQGVVFGRDLLGYDVKNGIMFINKQGAKTVNEIFHKFVYEHKSAGKIAQELTNNGIPTQTGKQWSSTAILRILRNEKYCGDLIQKKTITKNYLTHEKKSNQGEEKMVVIKNHHQPIISRELFNMSITELKKRSPPPEQKSRYSNRYCFSGKIMCGICGSSFVVRSKKRKDGSIYRSWRCYNAVKNGSNQCNNCSINDVEVKIALMQIIKELPVQKEKITHPILAVLKILHKNDTDFPLNETIIKIQQIISGELWDDVFYGHILDVITVYQNQTSTVSLNMVKE